MNTLLKVYQRACCLSKSNGKEYFYRQRRLVVARMLPQPRGVKLQFGNFRRAKNEIVKENAFFQLDFWGQLGPENV